MRVVVDTNVLISGIFFGGPPGDIVELWRSKRITPVVSESIISEYFRVARKIHEKHPRLEIDALLEMLIINAEIIDASGFMIDVCKDPDDNKFLECAMAGECRMVISGDNHLLEVSRYQNVRILTPRDFLEKYGPF